MLGLLANRWLLQAMGVRAQELIRERYLLEYELNSLRKVYEQALSGYRAANLAQARAA